MQLKDWLVNKDSVPVLQPFADWTSVMQASKSVARTASSAAEQLQFTRPKTEFSLLREHSEMGLLVGFKLRLARSNCFG